MRIETVLNTDASSGNAYAEYANTIAKKLLAGDTDFDLFWISTETPTLFKEGYFYDLSTHPLLETYLNLMAPGVRDLCSVGGVPALYPTHLYTTSLAVYGGMAGEDFVPPATFDDFLAFTESMRVPSKLNLMEINHIRSAVDPWLNQLISNIIEGRGEDDDAETTLTALLEWGLDQFKSSDPEKSGVIRAVIGSTGADYVKFSVPLLDEAYGTPYNGYFLAVNPNSPNRELAALYLAYKMEYACSSGSVLMNPDFDYSGGIRAYPTAAYSMTVYVLMEGCADGEMTASEAAEQIMREMKMLRDE